MLEQEKLTKDKFIERLIEELSATPEGVRQLAGMLEDDIRSYVSSLEEKAKDSSATTVTTEVK